MTKDVTRYCLELESLTRRAYPDASEEELSRTRAGELVSQLTEWPEYLQLFTTMELAPKHSAYEMVKAMAQRCERSKEIAETMRETSDEEVQRHLHLEGLENHVVGRREEDSQPLETSSLSGTSCRSGVQKQSSFKNKIKCYNCNKLGHSRRDCRNRKVAEKTAEKDEPSQGSSGTAKMFTASLSRWIGGSVSKVKGHDELVRRQTVTNVRLLGLTRKALLDTGSQISIIPLGMFQASLASGFDLDADVEEIPINQRAPVYDASGNKMSFKGAVRLTLQLGNGAKRRIAVFVMAGGDGKVVLGTNALAKLGIGPTSTSGVLMTVEKAANEAAGKTSTTVKPTHRRRRRNQLSDVAMRNNERRAESAEAPNSSSLAGAKLIRVGEGVGKHERSHVAVKSSQGRWKRKQQTEAVVESAIVLPTNRMSVPTAGTACSKCGRFPEMRMDEENGSNKQPVAKSSAGAKLLRAGKVDRGHAPIQPRKSRAERGRPRKARQKERTQSGKILCSRTLLVTGEQLGLRRARDISGQMDEVDIPSLKNPLVRSDQMAEIRSFCRHLTGFERRECCGALAFLRSPSEDRRESERKPEEDPTTWSARIRNNRSAASHLESPSKRAVRRPRREDARKSFQPRGTADSTPSQDRTQPLNGRRRRTGKGRDGGSSYMKQPPRRSQTEDRRRNKSRDDSSRRRGM
ncbi:hypothetical protein Y032_0085g1872 [Ancylostoma ceylanicum]|nr:hypothetical protein Y032_0085g1872 [Ancylostoma ceylanicum]